MLVRRSFHAPISTLDRQQQQNKSSRALGLCLTNTSPLLVPTNAKT
ncbi:unnamed protein product, partial [Timema podura]|nr:unnamed protein product [Timema podura]